MAIPVTLPTISASSGKGKNRVTQGNQGCGISRNSRPSSSHHEHVYPSRISTKYSGRSNWVRHTPFSTFVERPSIWTKVPGLRNGYIMKSLKPMNPYVECLKSRLLISAIGISPHSPTILDIRLVPFRPDPWPKRTGKETRRFSLAGPNEVGYVFGRGNE